MKINFTDKKNIAAWLLYLLVAALCISAVFTHFTLNSISKQLSSALTDTKVQTVSAPMIASDALYTLYECGGKIGIYDAHSGMLVDIVDVFVSTLPTSDRMALKKGIDIYTFSNLTSIIADFTS